MQSKYDDTVNGETPPNTSKVIPPRTMCEPLTLQMIADALEKAPEENDRACRECGGSGLVTWYYHDMHDCKHSFKGACPMCNGTGKRPIHTDDEYHFTIYGVPLCKDSLDIIQRTMYYLGTDTLRLRHVQEYKAFLFDVEDMDIEICIWPKILDKGFKEIKIM